MVRRRDGCNSCVCQVCDDVRARLDQIFVVLETYRWLLDTYIVDFFEDNAWNKLPEEWRKVLNNASPEELGEWVLGNAASTRVWPLSLLAFRQTIKSLGINRDHTIDEILKCNGSQENSNDKDVKNVSQPTENLIVHPKYEKLFTKSVKEKKRHEIGNISRIASECAIQAECECIVDIGAGMGHLARTLAFNHGLRVVCLEQNESLSNQARECDENLLALLRKKMPEISQVNQPHHISLKVSDSDVEGDALAEKLMDEFTRNFDLAGSKENRGFGLIGLHTCGDLAATLIKFYAKQEAARFICIVGCCYMKITSGTKTTESFGYPLSDHVSMVKNHELSYAALELACHAIENHCDKLRSGNHQDLLVHAYRATLETILIKKNGRSIRRSRVNNVKLQKHMSFRRYCEIATEILKPENQPDPTDFDTVRVSDCLKRWNQVIAFGTLRFMLAPLVETAVLLDRFLYLSECHLKPSLRAIFDPRISPRNIVLTSGK